MMEILVGVASIAGVLAICWAVDRAYGAGLADGYIKGYWEGRASFKVEGKIERRA